MADKDAPADEPKAGGIAEFLREKTGFNKLKNSPARLDKAIEKAGDTLPEQPKDMSDQEDAPRLSGNNRSKLL